MTNAKVVGKPMEFPDRVVVRHLINGCFELHPVDFLAAEGLTQQLCSGVGVRADRGRQGLLCVGRTTIPPGPGGSRRTRGRLQDLARGRLYAQAAVIASEGGLGLSAPYVSGLAGSILASEVLKTGPLTSQRLVGRVDVDMSGFPTGFQSSPSRDLSGRCLCYSTARRKGYDELWRSVA